MNRSTFLSIITGLFTIPMKGNSIDKAGADFDDWVTVDHSDVEVTDRDSIRFKRERSGYGYIKPSNELFTVKLYEE